MLDLDKLTRSIRFHPVIFVFTVWGALFAIGGGIGYLASVRAWFSSMIRAGVQLDPEPKQFTVTYWLFLLLLGSGLALVAFMALYVQSEVARREAVRLKDERSTIAYKTMRGMMWAATRIRDQYHPNAMTVRKAFKKIDVCFRINSKFDAEVTQEWAIYAGQQEAVTFWTTSVRASADATHAEYLDDIEFRVSDKSGRGIAYLPTFNDPLEKKVLFWFLPRIEPGEAPRIIEWGYTWKGIFNQLRVSHSEEFLWSTESIEPIESISFKIIFQKGSGLELTGEVLSPSHAGAKPEPISETHKGIEWSGFTYQINNVPAGKCQVGLVLKLKTA